MSDNRHKFAHPVYTSTEPVDYVADFGHVDRGQDGPRAVKGGEYYDHNGVGLMELTWARGGLEACRAHVLKYAWRAGAKPNNPAVKDLGKCRDWLEFTIGKLEG